MVIYGFMKPACVERGIFPNMFLQVYHEQLIPRNMSLAIAYSRVKLYLWQLFQYVLTSVMQVTTLANKNQWFHSQSVRTRS